MKRRQLRYFAEYFVFRCIVCTLACLPPRYSHQLADWLALFIHRILPGRLSRRHVSYANIESAFGSALTPDEIDAVICGMWRHLFRMVCEIIQQRRRFRRDLCSDVLDFSGRDRCVSALLSDRPVLFLSGHFGNWEIAVHTFGSFGFPMSVVARDLDNPWLHRWFADFRQSTGNRTVSKQGAGTELTEILEQRGHAALLCDQDAGRSGVFVDFFGKPASTFKSIALLALQYNALIVVGGAYRLPDDAGARWSRFVLATQTVLDPEDYSDADAVRQLTQDYTAALEGLVRRAPEQYFWVHRRWKTDPSAARRKRRTAA